MQEGLGNRVGVRLRGVGAAVACGLAFGLIGAVPHADAAKVNGGNASINANRGVVNQLRAQNVVIGAARPAVKRRNSVRLPFRRGNFVVTTNNPEPYEPLAVESITGQGVLNGGIRFTRRGARGSRAVVVRNIRVNLRNRRVQGRIGKRNLVLFRINIGWATPVGTARRPHLVAAPLRLTPAAARNINRRLGVNALRGNRGFGQLNVAPQLAG